MYDKIHYKLKKIKIKKIKRRGNTKKKKKEYAVQTHNGTLLSHKKNGITPSIATWMDWSLSY